MAAAIDNRRLKTGFTLIELIVVMVIIGIMATVLLTILRGPMQASLDVEKRSRLVDIAETALQRMTREIRLALPYSLRRQTSAGKVAIEFLRTFDGGRYRKVGQGSLKFINNNNSQTFTVLSELDDPATIAANTGTGSTDCINGNAFCLVIYNIGQPLVAPVGTPSANAYLGASAIFDGNIATISAVGDNTSPQGFDELTFNNSDLPNWNFEIESPKQRFHVIDRIVSFVCDTNTGRIYRHTGYAIPATQSTAPGGTANLLIDRVTACSFTLEPPTINRAGLLTLSITIQDAALGESVTLLQQVHLDNVP